MDLVTLIRGPKAPLLWDGGIGAALVDAGLDLSRESPEAWLVQHPDRVLALHHEFAAAGSDIIQTNTFGLLRLLQQNDPLVGERRTAQQRAADERHSPSSSATEEVGLTYLIKVAVALARQAAAPFGAQVIASLGPSGAGSAARVEEHAALVAALLAPQGVTALHLETFYDPQELRAAIRGVRAGAPGLGLLTSITVTLGNSGLETPLGTPLALMMKVMEREGPDAVGLNCSQSARRMVPAVEALRQGLPGVPILAQPQVGTAGPECRGKPRGETGESFAQGLLALLAAGADAVGGCCGCRGEHLSAARRALSRLASAAPVPQDGDGEPGAETGGSAPWTASI